MAEEGIVLPHSIVERLRKEASKYGESVEGFIIDILSKNLNLDPEDVVKIRLKLAEKYIKEANKLLLEGEYSQASEKAWGASSQVIKAVAAKRGEELRSHKDVWEYATRISRETGDDKLLKLFHVANSLHVNFYENWMTKEAVENGIRAVEELIKRSRKLL